MSAQNLVFAPHIYDAPAILAAHYVPALSLFPRSLRRIERAARRLEMPLLVGEFGVLNGAVGGARMMEDECRMLDRVFASWTVWHYNPTGRDWNDEGASIVTPAGGDRPWTGAPSCAPIRAHSPAPNRSAGKAASTGRGASPTNAPRAKPLTDC